MIYKNTIKLTMSNFSHISRVLVFILINFAILFGLSYVSALPIINLLNNYNFIQNSQLIYNNFLQNFNITGAFVGIGKIISQFFSILWANFSLIGFNVVILLFIIIILGAFLNGLYSLVVTNALYYYMSNNVKFGFMPSFISTLGLNIKYSLAGFITKLPFNIIVASVVVGLFRLTTIGYIPALISPFLIILVYLILNSVKLTLFGAWAPSVIVFDKGIFYGFDKSLKLTRRKLKKVFSNAFYLQLTIFVINVFAGIVTFGVSLIITLPMTIMLTNCFGMVIFYSNYGMRYYVDEFNVIVPTKLEQTEPISTIKYLI